MQLIRFSNPQDFEGLVKDYLLQHEAEHNLLLGLLGQLVYDPERFTDPYMAMIESADRIHSVILRTPPHSVVMSTTEPSDLLYSLLVDDLYDLFGTAISGIVAERMTSKAFADKWTEKTNQHADLRMAERIYRLDEVILPENVPGQMRRATTDDFDLLVDWRMEFAKITPEMSITRAQSERMGERYLKNDPQLGIQFVWEVDGVPVSMTNTSRPTPNGATVTGVYTPPEQRRKGYAGALVAHVSQWVLTEMGKKFCTLYTDLSNPTSNKIYQEVGYRPVQDVDMYVFE